MTDRPAPLRDLDLDPARVRKMIDDAADLVQEYLERLPSLAIDRPRTAAEVRDLVAQEIPEEGVSDEALGEYLRSIVFDSAMYTGHPAFLA
ncbi:MAG: hypothetical protein M3285_13345, partial [Actinomycetota bacterium]|nr:hypothetical protein [Actinomycetota bacterium]